MPPLRFKAVCTETGREFNSFGLHTQRLPNHDGINFIDGYHLIVSIGACKFDAPNIELCQSTGLYDANGHEVFFGDVVTISCTCCDPKDICYVDFKQGRIVYTPVSSGDAKTGHFNKIKVIGNKWMPQFKK